MSGEYRDHVVSEDPKPHPIHFLTSSYRKLGLAAERLLRRERRAHTLRPLELVHLAWLLAIKSGGGWTGTTHFRKAIVAHMGYVLTDHARRSHAKKRAGRRQAIPTDMPGPEPFAPPEDLASVRLALNDMAALGGSMRRKADAMYRWTVCGWTQDEIAESLGVSRRTISSDLEVAREWLRCRLEDAHRPGAPDA